MVIEEYLESAAYPGRILVGGTLGNGKPFALYAITGRSERSRNRVIRRKGSSVVTELYDRSGDADDLLIYSLCMEDDSCRVLANGSHADSVFSSVRTGRSLFEAMEGLSYEPDELSTPRIALSEDLRSGEYELGIVRRSADGRPERVTWSYKNTPGFGHIISTYNGSVDNPEAFSTDPAVISLGESASDFIDRLYGNLRHEYRVALYACYEGAERIINELGN